MGKKKFTKKDLIELLVKKAQGFYYDEQQIEYEKPQNKTKNNENSLINYKNLSFFDNIDRGNSKFKNSCDNIKASNGEENIPNQIHEEFAVVKKKITTHFIPPDMLAIKILFEIFGKEVNQNEIENLTDKELIELKNKLLMELSNEDKNN